MLEQKKIPRLVIAATGSGAGKTTVTLALLSALKNQGLQVQSFKCGPDYIDPGYHTALTGRQARNLDSWMGKKEDIVPLFCQASAAADIAIVEGVMGFFDGRGALTNEGSTAEISELLSAPVLLVVNCQSMARSVAAVVKGFQLMSPGLHIAGVIANKLGSLNHYQLVKEAIEKECGVPVVGYFLRNSELAIPERHLGLLPAVERNELAPLFERLGQQAAETFDLPKILSLADSAPLLVPGELSFGLSAKAGEALAPVRIAVARDMAFNFYYPENLQMLQAWGIELLFFSPLAGESLPAGSDGLYLGGGFPEEFAGPLSQNEQVKNSIRQAIEDNLPVLAECGGFMYLTGGIIAVDGTFWPLLGILPGKTRMQSKLAALGYREISASPGNPLLGELQARGHEFHYSVYEVADSEKLPPACLSTGLRGQKTEGCLYKNVVAGYVHFYFPSQPQIVKNWYRLCLDYRRQKEKAQF